MVFLLNGCEDKSKNRIARIVQEWQDKEIVFPQKMVFTKHGKDTLDFEISPSSYKIIKYIDSIGCTSCKL